MQITTPLWEHRATLRNIAGEFGTDLTREQVMYILWTDALQHPEFADDLLCLRSAISDMDDQEVAATLARFS